MNSRGQEIHRLQTKLGSFRFWNFRVVLQPKLQKSIEIDQLDVDGSPFRFPCRIASKAARRDEDSHFPFGADNSPQCGNFSARTIPVLDLHAYVRSVRT